MKSRCRSDSKTRTIWVRCSSVNSESRWASIGKTKIQKTKTRTKAEAETETEAETKADAETEAEAEVKMKIVLTNMNIVEHRRNSKTS